MTNSTLPNEFVTDTMGLVLRIERRKNWAGVQGVSQTSVE